ncbi:MAG: HRDC domain-containing protein [Pyrinomonadaceae bacterium]
MLKLAGLQPAAMVDTLQLARSALVAPSYSLKSLITQLFGIQLDKNYQRSNWRRRPLSEQQLLYAATDAHVTLRLFFELRRMLEGRGQWPVALHSATLRERSNTTAGPQRRRIPQSAPAPLTIEEQQAVKRLKDWRLEVSRHLRVPACMICPDRTLDHLAQTRPATINELHQIYGLGSSKIERFGKELLKAVHRAFETGKHSAS